VTGHRHDPIAVLDDLRRGRDGTVDRQVWHGECAGCRAWWDPHLREFREAPPFPHSNARVPLWALVVHDRNGVHLLGKLAAA